LNEETKMKSRIWIHSVLALALVAVPAVAIAEPTEIGRISYNLSSGYWDQCVAEVDAAYADGKTPETVAHIGYTQIPGATEFVSNTNHVWSAPLSAVRTHCAGKLAEREAKNRLGEIEDVFLSARDLHKSYFVDDGDVVEAWDLLVRVSKKCPTLVDAAIAAGVSADAKVTPRGGKAITIANGRTQFCDPLTHAVTELAAKKAAEEEAFWAPYKKLLSGSKLDLVLARGANGWYGKGCKQLSTANALAKATVWYEVSVDTSGIRPRWNLRTYKFKGNKLAGTTDKSGWGNDAPSSACR
jgi:hypothetical protein